MDKVKQSVLCFKEGFSCSQAVFATYAVDMGMDREKALKIAQAFGGGMGHMGDVRRGGGRVHGNRSEVR